MSRIVPTFLIVLACIPGSVTVRAQTTGSGLIASSTASRYGLERAWFAQVRMAPGGRGIVDLQLHISSTTAQTLFRVLSEQGPTYTFSNRDLNVFGEPLGEEGAGKAAAEKVRLLRLAGIESRIEQAVVPDIRLFATTGNGIIHALDAETGSTLWTTAVGSMRYPTTTPAVTEEHLAVVNGQTLYILTTDDGKIIAERRVVGGPGAGPAIAGGTVYLPLLNGQLKAFGFGPDTKPWPETFYSRGSILTQPTAAGDRMVWANSEGDISIITAGKSGIRHRLRMEQPAAGPVIYVPPQQLLCVTLTGYVYSFDAESGELMWRYASGDATAQPAAIVEDLVFLMTRHRGLQTISTSTGQRVWPAAYEPAHRFLAATSDRVYCTDEFGQLIVLSAQTGHAVGRIPLNLSDYAFANNVTDRIYVATNDGILQCLRELGTELPTLHLLEPLPAAPNAAEPGAKPDGPGEPPADATSPDEPVNPFESKGSPFGS